MGYEKFIRKIYKKFEGIYTHQEVDDLLAIKENFQIDNPIATGKRLIIDNVTVIGHKDGQGFEKTFSYEQGTNILIADNLKGKSTIFKIIKYALTGKNSLQQDVQNWLNYAVVQFSISSKKYTVYICFKNKDTKFKGVLFNKHIDNQQVRENQKNSIVFEAASKTAFVEEIQNFFFQQFSYYSLKWTQKKSGKDSIGLGVSNASWKTYFKSILLESKDSYTLMYGAQQRKVFEMLLGVQFTHPLNRLNVKRDMLESDKAIEALRNKNTNENNTDEIERKIQLINEQLYELDSNKNVQKFNSVSAEIGELQISIEQNYSQLSKLNNQINLVIDELFTLNKEHKHAKEEKRKIESEITNTQKQINDLEEFIAIGAFFSNLDIKHCPACDHTISSSHKKLSTKQHTCSLCHEDVSHKEVDTAAHENKIDSLRILLSNLETKKRLKLKEVESIEIDIRAKKKKLSLVESEKVNLPNLSQSSGRLNSLQRELTTTKLNIDDAEKTRLIEERGALQYQLKSISSNSQSTYIEDYDSKVDVINAAITQLTEMRAKAGTDILAKFTELMVTEIQTLGLQSISEVVVDARFDIRFKQGDNLINFDNISEGEKLRVRIAFYLSLIQMDIEFNLGRHTRLLMIDSPAKEEADNNYLNGLSELLNNIESRFGDQLQILVATAERGLENTLLKQTIIPQSESVF